VALSAIKDNGMGATEKGDYATVKAYVNFIKHSDADPWYTACTTPNCNKKVVESGGGNWMCEKCNLQLSEVSSMQY
jgi:replication factor A1